MLVVILLGIIIAVMCYMVYTFRAEFFRLSERQSNTLMHVARMNRGLLSSMQELLTPAAAETEDQALDGAMPSAVEEVAMPSVVEEVASGEELASAPVVAPVPGVLPVIEEVPRH